MSAVESLMQRLPDTQSAALITTPHNRRYLTGFPSSAGCVLVTKNEACFLTDFRYIEAAKQHIRHMACACCSDIAGELQTRLATQGIKRVFVEADGMTLAECARYRQRIPHVEWVDSTADGASLDAWLTALRMSKTPEQLACIRQAQRLTEDGFEHILSCIRPGRTEREIALELEFFIRGQGAEGVAFDFIVVSGANGALPHGVPGDKPVEAGDFVTMDFGAVVDGWHSDMTRTVAVGHVSEEQRKVYDTVLRAQQGTLAALHAGASCVACDATARNVIAQAGYGDYFGHGTGHGVGVEIHEQPRLSPGAGEAVLEAGSVVTVEPGIYLPGKFGVRIEDMAVITENGCENLTKSPKQLLIL